MAISAVQPFGVDGRLDIPNSVPADFEVFRFQQNIVSHSVRVRAEEIAVPPTIEGV